MNNSSSSEHFDHHRRRLLANATMAAAATQFGKLGAANAQSGATRGAAVPATKPGMHTSFAPLKQIEAGLLNIGYAEAGPADGPR